MDQLGLHAPGVCSLAFLDVQWLPLQSVRPCFNVISSLDFESVWAEALGVLSGN